MALESEFMVLGVVALSIVVAPLLATRVGIPGVIAEFLVGFIIGPYGLGLIRNEYEWLSFIGALGLVFLMFLAGLESDPEIIREDFKAIILVGAASFILPLTVGLAFALSTSLYSFVEAMLLAFLFSAGSAGVLIPILRRYADRRLVHIMIGGAIVDEVLSLLGMALIVSIFTPLIPGFPLPLQISPWGVALFVGEILIFLVIVRLLPKGIEKVIKKVGEKRVEEFEVRLTILLMLALVVVAEVLSFHAVIGAFLAGLALREAATVNPEFYDIVYPKITTIGYGLLIPVFFFTIGLKANITGLEAEALAAIALALALGLAFASKLAGGYVASIAAKLKRRDSIGVGFAMNVRLSVGIAIAEVGLSSRLIASNTYTLFVVISVVTTLVAALGLSRFMKVKPAVTEPEEELFICVLRGLKVELEDVDDTLHELLQMASRRRLTCDDIPVLNIKEKVSNREITLLLIREAVSRNLIEIKGNMILVTPKGEKFLRERGGGGGEGELTS
nr:cation:proton antiporter [Candidatus Freyrarchaeum guaymaensis]